MTATDAVSSSPVPSTSSAVSPSGLEVSVAVPMFAAPGVAGLRTPSVEQVSWPLVCEVVDEAERRGYRAAWFSDHLFHGRDGAFLECWTTLAAVAGRTQRIRLATNHYNNAFRAAPLTAKMVATADVISDGRVELFCSPGMRAREHEAYGFGWEPDRAAGTERLVEAVEVMRTLWRGAPPVTYAGTHYRLDDAYCAPGPVQPDGPPVWLGGPLDEATIDAIVGVADGWNALPSSVEAYADQAARIDAACRAAGRDPRSLRRSLETQVLVLDEEDQLADWLERWRALRGALPLGGAVADFGLPTTDDAAMSEEAVARLLQTHVIGTREQIVERLAAYRGAGLDELVCWFCDVPGLASLRALASDVLPAV